MLFDHSEGESCSVMSDSLQPPGLYSPWNSPGQNTGVGSLSLFQRIFPTQRLKPGLPRCRWILYQLSYKDAQKRWQVLLIKDMVKIIQQESYTYKNPVTEFVWYLYVNFDFGRAQKKLRKYESLLMNDFFLVACLEDYTENAELFIFEFFVSKYTASISVPPLTCWQVNWT